MPPEIEIGPHLLGRLPSPPDQRDFPLAAFLGSDDPLEQALAILQASHAAKATKTWAAIATQRIQSLPGTPSGPAPSPTPPPGPNGEIIWADPDQPLNQGNFGTCVGNGWAQFLNTDPVEDHADEAAARAIYYEATVIDGQPDDPDKPGGGQQGSAVRSGAKAVQNRGRIQAYAFAASIDEVIAWLTTKGPVVFGTDWYSGMFTPNAEGQVVPTGTVAGGHCYLAVGVRPASGEIEYLNSWGAGWGLAGRFTISVADSAHLLATGGEACTAVELPL